MHRTVSSHCFWGESFALVNRLSVAAWEKWLLLPGMLFAASEKWWDENRPRQHPHEGIDLCFFVSDQGAIAQLLPAVSVPVALSGRVRAIGRDFLGESIFVSHDMEDGRGRTLFSVYGHTSPITGLRPGNFVAKGDIIATLAPTSRKEKSPPPHLHLSLIWLPELHDPGALDWRMLASLKEARFEDPLPLLGNTYVVQEKGL